MKSMPIAHSDLSDRTTDALYHHHHPIPVVVRHPMPGAVVGLYSATGFWDHSVLTHQCRYNRSPPPPPQDLCPTRRSFILPFYVSGLFLCFFLVDNVDGDLRSFQQFRAVVELQCVLPFFKRSHTRTSPLRCLPRASPHLSVPRSTESVQDTSTSLRLLYQV